MQPVTKLTLTLLAQYADDITQAYTINQLARRAKKPYANTHTTVTRLLEQQILTKETVGHSHLCRLNLRNETACLLLALSHTRRTSQHATAHLVFQRENDLLIISDEPPTTDDTWITLEDFRNNDPLFTTVGRWPLLRGHATYAHLLHEWSERQ